MRVEWVIGAIVVGPWDDGGSLLDVFACVFLIAQLNRDRNSLSGVEQIVGQWRAMGQSERF